MPLLEVKDILDGRSFTTPSVVGKTELQPVLPMDMVSPYLLIPYIYGLARMANIIEGIMENLCLPESWILQALGWEYQC